jgi:ribosomal protein S19E (S16A)
MLVLGGIGSSDKPERPWFVSQLALIVRKLHIMDWVGVEDIL